MTEDTFKIGLVQHACVDDRQKNIDAAVKGVREAVKRGAQVICLQELFASPYFCKSERAERFDLAEPIPGPTTEAMAAVARELSVAIVVPVFERRAAGVYHNSAAVVDADGSLLGVYRKMHIPDDPLFYEKFYFAPGEAGGPNGGFRIFKTRYATIGVLICWDQWYPEAARITSLMGAEVLFYPTAIGWHPDEKESEGPGQVEAWRTIQRSHAVANGVYVGAPNRIGHEPEPGTKGIEFFGQSFVADPFGRIVAEAEASAPAVVVAEVSRSRMEDVRRHWPFLRDRRIDAYGRITSRWVDEEKT